MSFAGSGPISILGDRRRGHRRGDMARPAGMGRLHRRQKACLNLDMAWQMAQKGGARVVAYPHCWPSNRIPLGNAPRNWAARRNQPVAGLPTGGQRQITNSGKAASKE